MLYNLFIILVMRSDWKQQRNPRFSEQRQKWVSTIIEIKSRAIVLAKPAIAAHGTLLNHHNEKVHGTFLVRKFAGIATSAYPIKPP
jgi:hypothetical protein